MKELVQHLSQYNHMLPKMEYRGIIPSSDKNKCLKKNIFHGKSNILFSSLNLW